MYSLNRHFAPACRQWCQVRGPVVAAIYHIHVPACRQRSQVRDPGVVEFELLQARAYRQRRQVHDTSAAEIEVLSSMHAANGSRLVTAVKRNSSISRHAAHAANGPIHWCGRK